MPSWFPFTEAEARSAFRRILPPESINGAVDACLSPEGGVWLPDNTLILLALESPSAMEHALAMRPLLAGLIREAAKDPDAYRRRIATAMGL